MATRGIYGLSGSGIDVDSMVKVGMLSKQNQYDKMYKKEIKNEWIKQAYADVYSKLSTFTNSTMSTYKRSYTTNPMSVSSNNTSIATATANSDAAQMSHTITVNSVAANAYMQTEDKLTRNSGAQATSIALTDFFDTTQLKAEYDADKKNKADEVALSFTLTDAADQVDGRDNADQNKAVINFTFADLFDSNQTLNDLVSKINAAGTNIQASYDSTNDSFSLFQKNGGEANQINISVTNYTDDVTSKIDGTNTDVSGHADNAARELINNLHLAQVTTDKDGNQSLATLATLTAPSFDDPDNPSPGTDTISAKGTDGSATIDGKTYNTTSQKLTVANVTYTLGTTGTTTMTVSQDTDKIVENVKQFVEDYNKMMDELTSKYNEKKYSDYDVLTKSQENAMTQEQIDKWNEKAKSGLLYHNQSIGKIRSAMREAMYTPVESVNSSYNTMMSIGIESSTDQGHISLNEDKLKKALAADPDCVYQIFASSGDTKAADGTSTTDYDKEGVINRITDSLYANMKEMKSYAGTSTEASDGSSLGDLILEMQTKMSNFKTQMDAFENALYKKYDAMESTIQQLTAQFNYMVGGNS